MTGQNEGPQQPQWQPQQGQPQQGQPQPQWQQPVPPQPPSKGRRWVPWVAYPGVFLVGAVIGAAGGGTTRPEVQLPPRRR
jgi:hypothetical protein